MIDQSIIFFFAIIIIIGALLLFAICISKKGVKHLDVERYRAKCLEIEHQLKVDEPSSYALSVLNADKLVDQALRERGVKGQTMGERMKNSASTFSDRNGIWAAHKLRNQISHEPDFSIKYGEAKFALAQFRKALKDLGAI
jgi:dihydrodipicolinate reductase